MSLLNKSKKKLNKTDICPYIKSSDCGRPDKNPLKFCALYKHCISYHFLNEFGTIKEEKANGKDEACSTVD